MCFNTESSLIVFTIGILSSLYLFYRGFKYDLKSDILDAIMVLLISFMQIIEFVLWKNQVCNSRNRLASYFILILIFSQPVIYLLIKNYLNNSNKNKWLYNFIALLAIVIFFYYFINNIYSVNKLCSLKNTKTNRLEWAPLKIIQQSIFWIIILNTIYFGLPFLINYEYNIPLLRKYFLLIAIIIAIINSIYYTGYNFYSNWGSLWCFLAVFYGIICIIFPEIK